MSVTVKKLGNCQVELEITIPAEEVDSEFKKVYRDYSVKAKVPGFRPGKVPIRVLKRRFGEEVFSQEVASELLPTAFEDALNETDIEPFGEYPEQLEVLQIEEGKPLIAKATLSVMPIVVLGEYKGVRVEPEEESPVSENDIEQVLYMYRKANARYEVVTKRPVAVGDRVVIDYSLIVDDRELPPIEGYTVEIGSGNFLPEIEHALVDVSLGEERKISVKLPKSYIQEELAGKEVTFKIKLNEIKEAFLPSLDDEFAKEVGDFETLEDLRKDTRDRLEEQAKRSADGRLKNNILDKIKSLSSVEIPKAMIDHILETKEERTKKELAMGGTDFDDYLTDQGESLSTWRTKQRKIIEEDVKREFILEAIADAEGIEVSNEELEEQVNLIAAQSGQNPLRLKNRMAVSGELKSLQQSMRYGKVLDFLKENAKIGSSLIITPDQDLVNPSSDSNIIIP
jgi:trigger factor